MANVKQLINWNLLVIFPTLSQAEKKKKTHRKL